MHQPFGERGREERLHTTRTGTLTEKGDTSLIATESLDVAVHPAESL